LPFAAVAVGDRHQQRCVACFFGDWQLELGTGAIVAGGFQSRVVMTVRRSIRVAIHGDFVFDGQQRVQFEIGWKLDPTWNSIHRDFQL